METTNAFSSLLIVMVLAATVPMFLAKFKKLSIPIVVGEILAGILLGRSGFNLVHADDPILEFLAEFGLVFLMFLSGMEIDFSSLGAIQPNRGKSNGWSPLSLGGLSFLITLVIAFLSSLGLVKLNLVSDPYIMALVLSTTSLGVVVPVLKERGLIGGRYGQTILVAALIADFVTMLLITVDVAIISNGMTPEILLILLLFVAFFAFYRFGNLFFNRIPGVRQLMEELSHATAQIKVRMALAIMLVFVALSTYLGTEVILGAFLAGVIIGLLLTPDDLEVPHQLETIGYGFLIPIFFIHVGLSFNLKILFDSPQALALVPILLSIAIVIKLLSGMVFRLAFSWREALGAGALLSARLSLIIAACAIGVRLHVIREEVNSAIILVAILSVTLAPILFGRIIPAKSKKEKELYLVAGAGEFGMQVAALLRAHHEQVVLFDPHPNRVVRARQQGFMAIEAALDQPSEIAGTYFEQTKTLICTITDPMINFNVCSLARTYYGIPHVVSHVANPADLPKYEQIGAHTMNTAIDRSTLLVMLARNPATYELLTRTDVGKEISELRVENDHMIGKTLRQLDLPGDVLVLALLRNGELLVPHGNTRLEQGDTLTLVGTQEWVQIAHQMFALALD